MKRNQHYEALEVMCQRCFNHEMCMGTGCNPKIMLQEMIHHTIRLEKALDKAIGELMLWVDDWYGVQSTWSVEEWKEWCMKDD